MAGDGKVPDIAANAVMVASEEMPQGAEKVQVGTYLVELQHLIEMDKI